MIRSPIARTGALKPARGATHLQSVETAINPRLRDSQSGISRLGFRRVWLDVILRVLMHPEIHPGVRARLPNMEGVGPCALIGFEWVQSNAVVAISSDGAYVAWRAFVAGHSGLLFKTAILA